MKRLAVALTAVGLTACATPGATTPVTVDNIVTIHTVPDERGNSIGDVTVGQVPGRRVEDTDGYTWTCESDETMWVVVDDADAPVMEGGALCLIDGEGLMVGPKDSYNQAETAAVILT
jgi:23S rRNA C2498 (ribose-2'-O)-methylase RlmM